MATTAKPESEREVWTCPKCGAVYRSLPGIKLTGASHKAKDGARHKMKRTG